MIAPSPGRGERGAGRVKVDSQTPISPIGYTRFDLLIEVRDGDTAYLLSPGARPSPLDSPSLERRFSGVQDVEAQPLGRPKPPTHAPTHRCCCGSRPRNGFGDEPSPSSRKDFGLINLRANNARAERGVERRESWTQAS